MKKSKNELLQTECSYENTNIDINILKRLNMLSKAAEYVSDMINSISFDDKDQANRLLHGAIGLKTEIGELYDAYKKHWFYGKELDIENVKEEIGDIIWYTELLADVGLRVDFIVMEINFFSTETNINPTECRENVIKKLRVRYPDGFTEFDAENRNTEEEMKAFSEGEKDA